MRVEKEEFRGGTESIGRGKGGRGELCDRTSVSENYILLEATAVVLEHHDHVGESSSVLSGTVWEARRMQA